MITSYHAKAEDVWFGCDLSPQSLRRHVSRRTHNPLCHHRRTRALAWSSRQTKIWDLGNEVVVQQDVSTVRWNNVAINITFLNLFEPWEVHLTDLFTSRWMWLLQCRYSRPRAVPVATEHLICHEREGLPSWGNVEKNFKTLEILFKEFTDSFITRHASRSSRDPLGMSA